MEIINTDNNLIVKLVNEMKNLQSQINEIREKGNLTIKKSMFDFWDNEYDARWDEY